MIAIKKTLIFGNNLEEVSMVKKLLLDFNQILYERLFKKKVNFKD